MNEILRYMERLSKFEEKAKVLVSLKSQLEEVISIVDRNVRQNIGALDCLYVSAEQFPSWERYLKLGNFSGDFSINDMPKSRDIELATHEYLDAIEFVREAWMGLTESERRLVRKPIEILRSTYSPSI